MSIWCSTEVLGDDRDPDSKPGTALAYQGSHVYPQRGVHGSAVVHLAYIPTFCRGPEDEWEQWCRLAIDGDDVSGDVVLDRQAVESLRDMLTTFLATAAQIEEWDER